MAGLVSCVYPDEFGNCPSNCGLAILANLLFSAFLCASNFILLNLVMAVLMQELQAAIVKKEEDNTASVGALVTMSKAANALQSKLPVGKGGDGDAAPNNTTPT